MDNNFARVDWSATIAAQETRKEEAVDRVRCDRHYFTHLVGLWQDTPRVGRGSPEEAAALRTLARQAKTLARAITDADAEDRVLKRFTEAAAVYQ